MVYQSPAQAYFAKSTKMCHQRMLDEQLWYIPRYPQFYRLVTHVTHVTHSQTTFRANSQRTFWKFPGAGYIQQHIHRRLQSRAAQLSDKVPFQRGQRLRGDETRGMQRHQWDHGGISWDDRVELMGFGFQWNVSWDLRGFSGTSWHFLESNAISMGFQWRSDMASWKIPSEIEVWVV